MSKLHTLAAAVLILFALHAQSQQKITLDDILVTNKFKSQSIGELRSMNDGLHYTLLEMDSKVVKYSFKTGEEVEVLFDLSEVEDAKISAFSNYEFSNDETKILLTTNKKEIYRHSFTAEYYIWNSVTEELTSLSDKGAQQAAAFSPDGNRVAFVRNNNIYLKNLKFGSESQATFDGKINEIINGIPDWVYEEEFSFNKALWWSPDSKFVAFLRFDETDVSEFSIPMYEGESPRYNEHSPYPGFYNYKYPKAGEKNSEITVRVYEIRSKTTINVDIGEETDIYVPRLKWTPDGNDLVVMRLNRRQNQLDVLYANPYTGDSRRFFSEKNDKYIEHDFFDQFTYLDNGNFVVNSERNGWSHLYLYDSQGFELTQITKGEYDVTDFYGYDEKNKIYYYQAAAESPLQREVYFVNLDKEERGKVSAKQGHNRTVFSDNFMYYINYYCNSVTPELITVHENKKGEQIRVLQDNTVLRNTINMLNLPQKSFFSFTTTEGVQLNGYMIKPAGFDPDKKYPVVMTQYSGPDSQRVKDEWGKGINWENYLAQEGFLVACVDPRGTAARGEDFRKITYLQLGKYESDDQVEAARYLGTLPFVDRENIAIYGWSYGGFMVCRSMQKGNGVFKAGIAVASVTNWRFYDTVYTERYMRTPEENPEGYDDNSPLSHAEDMKGRLLIIHGSADDNVHAQNTYEFTEKMVQAGILFDMMIYTNRDHGIKGGNTALHLYSKMVSFLKEQLM